MAALRERIARPRKVLFILSFLNGRPMVAGRATAADGIIGLAGALNAVTEYDGYKLINDEAVIAARPDVVLAMERASFRLDAAHRVRASGLRHYARRRQQGLCFDGGPLSSRFRPALRAGGARFRECALSGIRDEAMPSERSPWGDACPAMTDGSPPAATASSRAASKRSSMRLRVVVLSSLLLVLMGAAIVAVTIGAAGIPLHRIAGGTRAWSKPTRPLSSATGWCCGRSGCRGSRLRLIVGGLLAASGAIMQGLFRNPLADPALVGRVERRRARRPRP